MYGLILVYALAIGGAIGSLYRPLIGLYVYVGFAMLRPQFMWSFAGNMDGLSQLVAVPMLVGWAMHGFGGFKFGRARPVVIMLLAFSIWAQISAVLGIDSRQSNAWILELAKIVAPFLVGITLLDTPRKVWMMLWVIVGAHGYIGYEMNDWYYRRGYNFVYNAGYGFMDNNSFGLSLVTVLGPTCALALVARKWPERLLAGLCGVLVISTLVLTYSRGAMLGLGVAGLVGVLVIPKKPSYVVLMLLAALVVLRLAGPQVRERFETVFVEEDERDASAQSRINLWSACLQIASDNPLFGIGPRNFPLVAGNYGFTAGKEAHSTWMQAFAEMGFAGAGLLILFYLTTIVKLIPVVWQNWTTSLRQESAYAAGVLISLAGFFVSAQFVTMVGLETPYYVTMVGCALLRVRQERAVVTEPAPAMSQPMATLAQIRVPQISAITREVNMSRER